MKSVEGCTGGPAGQVVEMTVADFAIIKQLRVQWSPGFCVLTGETGAGKSLLIDALSAALGRRAESEWVRSGAPRAWVEVVFGGAEALPDVGAALNEMGCPSDDGSLVLGRDLQPGRNTSRVNGRAVPSHLVSGLADALIDIHSQGDHLPLVRPTYQRELLDRYGGLAVQRAAVVVAARNLNAARRELEDLESRGREAEREALLLRHELTEIDSAGPRPGEDEELMADRLRGKNALRLRSLAEDARRTLAGDERAAGALGLLGEADRFLGEIKALDATAGLDDVGLIDAVDAVQDIERALARYVETIEEEPASMEAVEQRLFLLADLKRKYGGTVAAILEYAAQAARSLAAFGRRDERIAELRAQLDPLEATAVEEMGALSEARRTAATRLEQAVLAELADLGLGKIRFSVAISQRLDPAGLALGPASQRVAFDETGADQVNFLIATNPDEPLRPLARVASGGELSRIMLGLKAALAETDRTPVLVFDELEQGVGGRMGDRIGEKLWRLARTHQVLCVTHLPQVAAYADAHYVISKFERDGATQVEVRLVKGDDRVRELAEMLGGRRAGRSLHDSARELLNRASRWREGPENRSPTQLVPATGARSGDALN